MRSTDCKEGDILDQLVWIIPVSIVGGILLLGVLLLIVAKCILMAIVSHHYTLNDYIGIPMCLHWYSYLCVNRIVYMFPLFLSSIMIGCQ